MLHDLDTPLFHVADGKGMSPWTIRHAVEGTAIFGGIGSGKTSGSGRMIARKLLEKNFGGLVLTSKPDEKALWIQYCREAGRLDDLIILEPGGQHAFNFLEYESTKPHGGTTLTENIAQVLKTVISASEEKSSGKNDDPFWENALDMLIFNDIDLGQLAYGHVSVQHLYDIVMTAPKHEPRTDKSKTLAFDAAFQLAQKKVEKQIDNYFAGFPPDKRAFLMENQHEVEKTILSEIPDAYLLKSVDQFFVENYRNISPKTRSIIEFSFSGFLFRLLKEPVYSLFCRRPSTFTPEDCRKGKIVLLNFPVKQYHKVGRDIQVMTKFIFQRAWESRSLTDDDHFVFLWADEAQHFLHEHDQEFQATARSAGIATVYLSQNLPNYYANMGGAKSEYRVKGFLGTLSTKIFHANADIETNRYASDLIGHGYIEDNSRTVTTAGKMQASRGSSLKLEKIVRPEEMVGLCTGGPKNGKRVSCFIHRQGNAFHNGFNFIEAFFPQD